MSVCLFMACEIMSMRSNYIYSFSLSFFLCLSLCLFFAWTITTKKDSNYINELDTHAVIYAVRFTVMVVFHVISDIIVHLHKNHHTFTVTYVRFHHDDLIIFAHTWEQNIKFHSDWLIQMDSTECAPHSPPSMVIITGNVSKATEWIKRSNPCAAVADIFKCGKMLIVNWLIFSFFIDSNWKPSWGCTHLCLLTWWKLWKWEQS